MVFRFRSGAFGLWKDLFLWRKIYFKGLWQDSEMSTNFNRKNSFKTYCGKRGVRREPIPTDNVFVDNWARKQKALAECAAFSTDPQPDEFLQDIEYPRHCQSRDESSRGYHILVTKEVELLGKADHDQNNFVSPIEIVPLCLDLSYSELKSYPLVSRNDTEAVSTSSKFKQPLRLQVPVYNQQINEVIEIVNLDEKDGLKDDRLASCRILNSTSVDGAAFDDGHLVNGLSVISLADQRGTPLKAYEMKCFEGDFAKDGLRDDSLASCRILNSTSVDGAVFDDGNLVDGLSVISCDESYSGSDACFTAECSSALNIKQRNQQESFFKTTLAAAEGQIIRPRIRIGTPHPMARLPPLVKQGKLSKKLKTSRRPLQNENAKGKSMPENDDFQKLLIQNKKIHELIIKLKKKKIPPDTSESVACAAVKKCKQTMNSDLNKVVKGNNKHGKLMINFKNFLEKSRETLKPSLLNALKKKRTLEPRDEVLIEPADPESEHLQKGEGEKMNISRDKRLRSVFSLGFEQKKHSVAKVIVGCPEVVFKPKMSTRNAKESDVTERTQLTTEANPFQLAPPPVVAFNSRPNQQVNPTPTTCLPFSSQSVEPVKCEYNLVEDQNQVKQKISKKQPESPQLEGAQLQAKFIRKAVSHVRRKLVTRKKKINRKGDLKKCIDRQNSRKAPFCKKAGDNQADGCIISETPVIPIRCHENDCIVEMIGSPVEHMKDQASEHLKTAGCSPHNGTKDLQKTIFNLGGNHYSDDDDGGAVEASDGGDNDKSEGGGVDDCPKSENLCIEMTIQHDIIRSCIKQKDEVETPEVDEVLFSFVEADEKAKSLLNFNIVNKQLTSTAVHHKFLISDPFQELDFSSINSTTDHNNSNDSCWDNFMFQPHFTTREVNSQELMELEQYRPEQIEELYGETCVEEMPLKEMKCLKDNESETSVLFNEHQINSGKSSIVVINVKDALKILSSNQPIEMTADLCPVSLKSSPEQMSDDLNDDICIEEYFVKKTNVMEVMKNRESETPMVVLESAEFQGSRKSSIAVVNINEDLGVLNSNQPIEMLTHLSTASPKSLIVLNSQQTGNHLDGDYQTATTTVKDSKNVSKDLNLNQAVNMLVGSNSSSPIPSASLQLNDNCLDTAHVCVTKETTKNREKQISKDGKSMTLNVGLSSVNQSYALTGVSGKGMSVSLARPVLPISSTTCDSCQPVSGIPAQTQLPLKMQYQLCCLVSTPYETRPCHVNFCDRRYTYDGNNSPGLDCLTI